MSWQNFGLNLFVQDNILKSGPAEWSSYPKGPKWVTDRPQWSNVWTSIYKEKRDKIKFEKVFLKSSKLKKKKVVVEADVADVATFGH